MIVDPKFSEGVNGADPGALPGAGTPFTPSLRPAKGDEPMPCPTAFWSETVPTNLPTLFDQGADAAGCLMAQAVPGSGAGAVKEDGPIAVAPRPAVATAGAELLVVVLCCCRSGSLSLSRSSVLELVAGSGPVTVRGTTVNGVLLLMVGLVAVGAIAIALAVGEI